MARRGPGRPPGTSTTSEDILRAARALFAERGYRATTVRGIASAAGVTPGMIHHFFGGKQQVFLAAVRMPIDPAALLDELTAGPVRTFPERFVKRFVGLWASEPTGPALQSMLRSALADEQQAAAIRTFVDVVFLPTASAALGVEPERVASAFSAMIGMVLVRHLIGVPALADQTDEQIVRRYVPIVRQALFSKARSRSA